MNKFMLLVTCITSIVCNNNYAASAATSFQHRPITIVHPVPDVIANHPRVKEARAHFFATLAKEQVAFAILRSVGEKCLRYPTDSNINNLISARAEFALKVTKSNEALKQLNEAHLVIAYCLMSAQT